MFNLFNSNKIKDSSLISNDLINRDYINIPTTDNEVDYRQHLKDIDISLIQTHIENEYEIDNDQPLTEQYNQTYKDVLDIPDDDIDQNDEEECEDDCDDCDDCDECDDEDSDDDGVLNEDELYVISIDDVPTFYCTDLQTAQNKIWKTAIKYNQESAWNNFIKSRTKNEIVITDYCNLILFNYYLQSYVLKINKVKKYDL
jgi:hypothetical protein